ncbi:hypothetical protein Bca101_057512 [Brassica carinata]
MVEMVRRKWSFALVRMECDKIGAAPYDGCLLSSPSDRWQNPEPSQPNPSPQEPRSNDSIIYQKFKPRRPQTLLKLPNYFEKTKFR